MTSKANKAKQPLIKFLCDYLPILVFFCSYKLTNNENRIVFATICMIATAFFGIAISYFMNKEIPKIAAFSTLLLTIFCGLSVYFKSDNFIKVKPTIVNLIFAAILYVGVYRKKPFLKDLLGEQIKLSTADWLIFSKRWALFFVFLAAINEIIWRNFSTDFWVQFKVFGMIPLTLIFTISQAPFILRRSKGEE